jgi:hypothetical protein
MNAPQNEFYSLKIADVSLPDAWPFEDNFTLNEKK